MNEKLKKKINVGALSVRNTKKNLPNCAQKENKGITLVALIITIIVLLILAVVAIRAVSNDGIISHAKNAQTRYEQEQAKELGILSGYELELAKNSPASLSDDMTTTKFEKTTFVKDEKGKTFVVPAGYTIVKDDTTANIVEVDKGVVITDGTSQFVWVPVNNINEMAKVTSGTDANGRTNYQGLGYSFTSTGANGPYPISEPAVVLKEVDWDTLEQIDGADNNPSNLKTINDILGTTYRNANDLLKDMQAEFNSMVESVSKYGGFFLSRYEVGSGDWYQCYAKAKTYNIPDSSVVSNMIYRCQYDAMLRWMQGNGIDLTCEVTFDESGRPVVYELNNIGDVLGLFEEWTQESDGYLYRYVVGSNVYRGYA